MPSSFERCEYKYWVDAELAVDLVSFARHQLVPDRGGPQRNVSIYLDGPGHALYHAHRSGMPDRYKLRARRYGGAQTTVFLEIKRKVNALTLKQRCEIQPHDLGPLLGRTYERLPETDQPATLERFLFLSHAVCAEPQVIVSCDRQALRSEDPLDESRLTLDSNIVYQPWRGQSFEVDPRLDVPIDGPGAHGGARPQVMLELKFAGVAPDWMVQMVCRFGLQRVAFSKYCSAVEREFAGADWNGDFHRVPVTTMPEPEPVPVPLEARI